MTSTSKYEVGLQRNVSLVDKLRSHSMTIGLLQQFSYRPFLYLPVKDQTLEQRLARIDQTLKILEARKSGPPDQAKPQRRLG